MSNLEGLELIQVNLWEEGVVEYQLWDTINGDIIRKWTVDDHESYKEMEYDLEAMGVEVP